MDYIKSVDTNQNGQVEFDEFVAVSQAIIVNNNRPVCARSSSSLQEEC